MKTILLCLLIMGLAFAAAAADVTGKWSGSFTPESGDGGSAYVILKQSGTTITGSGGPDASQQWPGLTGTINGNKLTFEVKSPDDGTVYKCELVLDGNRLQGAVTFAPEGGQPGKGKLDLTRVTE